jgi:D-glycero-alpha-D-manno-heptose-7-phosphate kinase
MNLVSTPLRISFVGGGTDFKAWFEDNQGSVISCAIDQYVHALFGNLSPIWGSNYKFTYSKLEEVKTINEIKHPLIRECFRKWAPSGRRISLLYASDMPGNSGLGSSSAFCNSINLGLNILQNDELLSSKVLAERSIHIEREVLGENGGWQDQIATAYGGFNEIKFQKDHFSVNPLPTEFINSYLSQCVLIQVGHLRQAHIVSKGQLLGMKAMKDKYLEMMELTSNAISSIHSNNLNEFSEIIDKSWELKAQMSELISNPTIDDAVSKLKELGASGIKLLGAGSGGFLLARFEKGINMEILKQNNFGYVTKINPDFSGATLNYRTIPNQ